MNQGPASLSKPTEATSLVRSHHSCAPHGQTPWKVASTVMRAAQMTCTSISAPSPRRSRLCRRSTSACASANQPTTKKGMDTKAPTLSASVQHWLQAVMMVERMPLAAPTTKAAAATKTPLRPRTKEIAKATASAAATSSSRRNMLLPPKAHRAARPARWFSYAAQLSMTALRDTLKPAAVMPALVAGIPRLESLAMSKAWPGTGPAMASESCKPLRVSLALVAGSPGKRA